MSGSFPVLIGVALGLSFAWALFSEGPFAGSVGLSPSMPEITAQRLSVLEMRGTRMASSKLESALADS